MPESSRKREGIKIFKRIRFLTTKHVDTDMCRREGTVCLTRSQLGHLIQVEKPCSQNVLHKVAPETNPQKLDK